MTTTQLLDRVSPTDYGDAQAEYRVLRAGAGLRQESNHGRVQVYDQDQREFLHRLTTNDVKRLPVGAGQLNVITSATARIIATLTVLARPDDLLLLTPPEEAARVVKHLRGQIFFMDQVKVDDISEATAQLGLYGPEAPHVLQKVTGEGVDDFGEFSWRAVKVEGREVTLVRTRGLNAPGFAVIGAAEDIPVVWDALRAAGAQPVGETAFEWARVEAGEPGWGKELTGDFTPLEARLLYAISETKGCYTGQEIIARQITYDKVARQLVGLRSDSMVPEGARVHAGGRSVGVVTSAVHSPALDTPIALAYIKRPHYEAGARLEVVQDDDSIRAVVAELPFT